MASNSKPLPASFRNLLRATVALAAVVGVWRLYPVLTGPFRESRRIEKSNEHYERLSLLTERQIGELKKRVHQADTPIAKENLVRRNGYVKPGQKRLLLDGPEPGGTDPR